MRALTITDDHQLLVAERPDPEPGEGEVLVRVHGAGLNRADLVQVAGFYPAPPGAPPDIPGMEFAGEVAGLGAGVSAWAVGDPVFGIVGGGAQAELLTVHASHCTSVPANLGLVEAGGVPEVFVTAHDAMVTQARAQAGETVLVHAVGSGVGTAGVQLAKALGATVVGTARTATKLEQCRALGLDHPVLAPRDLDASALADEIVAAAGPVDVVLELVGGDYVVADVKACARRGRIVIIGNLAGTRVELDLGSVMVKRLRVFGTVLRGRDVAEKAAATAAFARDVVPLLASGAITPVVGATFRLDAAADAYELLRSDTTFGKVILTPPR
jgi:NADPH:quinone reductase